MTPISRNRALLIGVGADLPNTINDANGLANVLVDPARCAYDPTKVSLLTEQGATRAAILRALDGLADNTPTDATVIIYFSGHGYLAESTLGTHYFLMPFGYDLNKLGATAISGQEFADKLAAIPAQRILLILDCCHAQGIGESKAPGLTMTKAPMPPEAERLFVQGSGRIIITSSKAAEVSFAGKPYSLFTRALIECLCGADVQDGDGYVRALDLAMYASHKVVGWSRDRQHPTADTHRADNFVVAYYAAGSKSPLPSPLPPLDPVAVADDINRQVAALPQTVTQQGFVNRPNAPVTQQFGNRVDTGGGAYIGGNVTTNGGKFVGRDDFSVTTRTSSQGTNLADFTALLKQIQQMIRTAPLAEEERDEVMMALAAIITQANTVHPNPKLITAKLKYIQALVEGNAGSSAQITALIQTTQRAIEMAEQVLH